MKEETNRIGRGKESKRERVGGGVVCVNVYVQIGKSHFGLFDLEKRILLIYMVSKCFVEFVIIFVIVVFRMVSIERGEITELTFQPSK